MWFATKDGLNRYDGKTFRVFKNTNSGLGCNFINTLYEDSEGHIWIGTEHGLFKYHPQTETISIVDALTDDTKRTVSTPVRHITTNPADKCIYIVMPEEGIYKYDKEANTLLQQLGENRGLAVNYCLFTQDRIWVGVHSDNLYYTDKLDSKFMSIRDEHDRSPFLNTEVQSICIKGRNTFVGTNKGLYRIDNNTMYVKKIFSNYTHTLNLSPDSNILWAGTQDGIFVVNTGDDIDIVNLTHPGMDEPFSLADNAVYSIYTDMEGGVWIGSYFGGINYLPPKHNSFNCYFPHNEMPQVGQRIREMYVDNESNVWIGTEDKGLQRFNTLTKDITTFDTHLLTNNIHGLCIHKGWLYVGAFAGGFERINMTTGERRSYFTSNTEGMISDHVFNIVSDKRGGVWMGTPMGLMYYDDKTDKVARVKNSPYTFIYDIMEAHDSVLWMGSYNNGLWSYDRVEGTFTHHPNEHVSKVINIYEDSKKRLWVMSHDGGLMQYDRTNGKFIPHQLDTVTNRFNIVYSMIEDRQGLLWCSTNNGLVSYNAENGTRLFYTTSDGLQSDQFNYQSAAIDSMGYIYFGCINGFVRFRPETFTNNNFKAPIVLSSLYIFDKLQTPDSEESVITSSINDIEHLVLESTQNSFSISARLLSYISPERNTIMYKLDGYDKDWHYLDNVKNTLISYSNLPYGTYTLHIKGANADGTLASSPRTLVIEIKPPLYLTPVAKILYVLIALLFVGFVVRLYNKRSKRKMRIAQQILAKEKEQELYDSKIRFFTNIAHEIRTPLTLIKSPLENMLNEPELSQATREDLDIAYKNTQNLVGLVNQLLDFRKLEIDGLRLNLQKTDVPDMLRGIAHAFSHSIKEQKLRFTLHAQPSFIAIADQALLSKVLFNLIGNAVKYAHTYIDVTLQTDDTNFIFTTVNDGAIVPLDIREEIFMPFVNYESEETNSNITTTGLGLALTRSLVEMHHGTICMDKDTTVNRFILTMPLQQDATVIEMANNPTHDVQTAKDKPVQEPQVDANDQESTEQTAQVVLIVEDNVQLCNFLQRHFSRKYTTLTASNGKEALNILAENDRVSIVISDVMMPEMDGIQLCTAIKENVDYSHIPVILLTAKTAVQARLDGLRSGADAYIDKPFNMPVLEQTMNTLIENRQRLYKAFSQHPYIITNTKATSEVEQEFLTKLNAEVEKNIEDPEFDVDKLAGSMNMSRSSLNRKVKATLNTTPNDYIRTERLRKAAVLLSSGKYKVNEVCYMVGFNTPSYFAKCFHKQYGVLPSDIE